MALALALLGCSPDVVPPYPRSELLTGVRFDWASLQTRAPGSDGWVLTWAPDGCQYASWGDGGGFGGTDERGRVKMGIARICGELEDFEATNVFGGHASLAEATLEGKIYGILALGERLWIWRAGTSSEASAFTRQELFVSHDSGRSFEPAGVVFTPDDFAAGRGFFALTFLQTGPGYANTPDGFVYIYGPEVQSDEWEVQTPGEIALLRVPRTSLADRAAYEAFAGLTPDGQPAWTRDLDARAPVFRDPTNGVMRTSVTYNAGLDRYLLVTQQRTRWEGGCIGIYESPSPWGPWRTVLLKDAWELGLQDGSKSVYWNFSNRWASADGRRSVLVYTGPGPDNFGAVRVELQTRDPERDAG